MWRKFRQVLCYNAAHTDSLRFPQSPGYHLKLDEFNLFLYVLINIWPSKLPLDSPNTFYYIILGIL